MPKLITPLDRSFSLTVESKYPERRVTEDDPIIVAFKQATEATNLRRQELLARPITRMWEDDKYREQMTLTSFAKRMAVDVFLTLSACNIEGPNGSRLFAFSQMNGYNRITDKTLEEFLKKWGQLWPEWAEAIYLKCLEVNPSWGFGGEEEDKEEEPLTQGEEVAGVEDMESPADLPSA